PPFQTFFFATHHATTYMYILSLHDALPIFCIMNPPFTSSRQPNLLFGSVPDKQRTQLQTRLKKLVKDRNLPVSITAGLAAVMLTDRKSTRLNSSHEGNSYAVFLLKNSNSAA